MCKFGPNQMKYVAAETVARKKEEELDLRIRSNLAEAAISSVGSPFLKDPHFWVMDGVNCTCIVLRMSQGLSLVNFSSIRACL